MTPAPEPVDAVICIDIAAEGWGVRLGGDAPTERLVTVAAQAALIHAQLACAVEVGVRLSDDADVRALNHSYRGRDSATNVLSFALTEPADLIAPQSLAPVLLGDVVLALETCVGEAARDGKPLADHVSHLVVHGVLHLLGYDHQSEDDATRMEALEREILARLGVPDPYARVAA